MVDLGFPNSGPAALRCADVCEWRRVVTVKILCFAGALLKHVTGSLSELVVQAKVNDWIDAAVEESQAAGDDEPEFDQPFTSHVRVGELVHCGYGFEDIVGEPRQDEHNDYRQDHFDQVPPSGLSSGVGSGDTVSVEVDDNDAVAEDDDQNGENERHQSHDEGQSEKKFGFVVVFAEWATFNHFKFPIHKRRDAQEERGKPHHDASHIDAPAASEVPRVHQLDHSDISVHTHAGQKEDIGITVDGDDKAAQSAQKVTALPEFPQVVSAGRYGPQRQSEDKNQISQRQINDERIHEAPTSLAPSADHADDQKITQKSREKYQIIKNW